MAFSLGIKSFKFICQLCFKCMMSKIINSYSLFFAKNDFSGFFICVINGPAVSFGQTSIY